MHSTEPWSTSRINERQVLICNYKLGAFVTVESPTAEEDANRIVACVNALAGVPTEELTQCKNRDDLLILLAKFVGMRLVIRANPACVKRVTLHGYRDVSPTNPPA